MDGSRLSLYMSPENLETYWSGVLCLQNTHRKMTPWSNAKCKWPPFLKIKQVAQYLLRELLFQNVI